MKNGIAWFAAGLSICAVIPYLIDVIKGKTKPNIVSWFTWTLLTGIATVATFAAGEFRTALLILGSTFCSLSVVLLGVRYGFAKMSKFDLFCQLGAMVGLVLWLVFDSPVLAIVTTVVVDFIGMLPTLRHAWIEPNEETWQTFAIAVIAASLTISVLNDLSVASLLYPMYLVFANITITGVVIARRSHEKRVM